MKDHLAKGIRTPLRTGQEAVKGGMVFVPGQVPCGLNHSAYRVAALAHDPPNRKDNEVWVAAFGKATLKVGQERNDTGGDDLFELPILL